LPEGFIMPPAARRSVPKAFLALALLAGCGEQAPPPPPEPRPVRVTTVAPRTGGDVVSLTGTIEAENLASLAFRIDGRMIERKVNVGDQVTAGQVIARLDPTNEQNNPRAARAELVAAQAQVNLAETRLGHTELVADAAGTVTQRGAEAGEVVAPGRMIVQIARENGRDAVFDVPPALKDAAPENPLIEVPASAMTRSEGRPAVWVVDQAAQTVALRPVEVARFDPARVLLASGLQAGEVVVTAGVQALRPGQKVRLLAQQSATR
jgi:multidrug efflux pump subunit AcrA (membrane-fusion protein)